MQTVNRPVTGVAALIINNGRLLLGYRSKSPGKNTWQCPGGLLDAGESIFDCAIRETREETGQSRELVDRSIRPGCTLASLRP